VVPVHNELPTLEHLVSRLQQAGRDWPLESTVLFVNDGSTDGSDRLLDEIVHANPGWRCLHLSRNFGHQAAVSAGLEQADGDAVVVMDADLQDPPEVIGELLGRWLEGFDVVYGVRRHRPEGAAKRMAYHLFYRAMARWSTVPTPLDAGDFCLIDRRVVDILVADFPERERFVRGLRAYAGFRQVGVPYDRGRRAAGDTKYSLRALIRLALSGLFGFTNAPQRFIWYGGVLLALAGMAVLAVELVVLFVSGMRFSSWSALLVQALLPAFLLTSSAQLLALGAVGEYVCRIHLEVKRRPAYIVEHTSVNRDTARNREKDGTEVLRRSPFAGRERARGELVSLSLVEPRSLQRPADRAE
jgi:dolichol-phosphate mannosyltransferase